MYNTVNITFFRPPLIVDDFLAITQLIFGLMKVINFQIFVPKKQV